MPFPKAHESPPPAAPADWDIGRSRLSGSHCRDRFPPSQSSSMPEALPIGREEDSVLLLRLHHCLGTPTLEAPFDVGSRVHCRPRNVEAVSYAFPSVEDRTIRRAYGRVCDGCPWRNCRDRCHRAMRRIMRVLEHSSMSYRTRLQEELLSGL